MHIVFIITLILVYPFLASFLSFFRVLKLLSSCIYRIAKLQIILLNLINNIEQCRIVFL
nr:MAG TPA: hypothetical protein [Caudoviricetes sp.]